MNASLALLRFARGGADPNGPLQFNGADVSPEALERLASEENGEEERQPSETLTLRGRKLAKASIRSANLSQIDMSEADLSEVSAGGACFQAARLEGATLVDADLVGADLSRISAGEANFTGALLEDARLANAHLRFADFSKATLDGADLSEADMWGVRLLGAEAQRTRFERARLDESSLGNADFSSAQFQRATLRRADLSNTRLRNANFQDAVLDGANLAGADLKGALLPNVSLTTCNLRQTYFAGAWLERTRMLAEQIGGPVGEEVAGDLEAAVDSYIVLERNFISLGNSRDASWAYLQRRKVEKQLHRRKATADLRKKLLPTALQQGMLWVGDVAAEWLCSYGESLYRVARAFVVFLFGFALLYWLTGSLRPREGFSGTHLQNPINYLLFSLDSMTTVGTSEIALRPKGELGTLFSSCQTVLGTVLLGLFGFVLGARIRS